MRRSQVNGIGIGINGGGNIEGSHYRYFVDHFAAVGVIDPEIGAARRGSYHIAPGVAIDRYLIPRAVEAAVCHDLIGTARHLAVGNVNDKAIYAAGTEDRQSIVANPTIHGDGQGAGAAQGHNQGIVSVIASEYIFAAVAGEFVIVGITGKGISQTRADDFFNCADQPANRRSAACHQVDRHGAGAVGIVQNIRKRTACQISADAARIPEYEGIHLRRAAQILK